MYVIAGVGGIARGTFEAVRGAIEVPWVARVIGMVAVALGEIGGIYVLEAMIGGVDE